MRREPTFNGAAFDAHDDETERNDLDAPRLLDRNRLDRNRLAVRLALCIGAIAGLVVLARNHPVSTSVPRAWSEPVTRATGIQPRLALAAATSASLLTLDPADPMAKGEPPRWNALTGLREDALSRGRFDAIEAPFLRISLSDVPAAPGPAPSLFVTLARRAAEVQGLSVLRTGIRGTIDTKFGPFETAEITLGGEGIRLCTGFSAIATKTMRIDGWLCGILGQAPEPREVACAIDAVKLAIAAAPTVEVAFGEAELRRKGGCSPNANMAAGNHAAEETGSIAGRKKLSGNRNVRRAQKNEAKITQAGL